VEARELFAENLVRLIFAIKQEKAQRIIEVFIRKFEMEEFLDQEEIELWFLPRFTIFAREITAVFRATKKESELKMVYLSTRRNYLPMIVG